MTMSYTGIKKSATCLECGKYNNIITGIAKWKEIGKNSLKGPLHDLVTWYRIMLGQKLHSGTNKTKELIIYTSPALCFESPTV